MTRDLNDLAKGGDLPDSPDKAPHLTVVGGRQPGSHDVDDEQQIDPRMLKLATPYEMLQAVYTRALRQDPEPEVLSTLSPKIDRLTGGYRPRTVAILGARSNWGKTKYTIALAVLAIMRRLRILVIGGEDSKRLYSQRYASARAGISAMAVRDNQMSSDECSALLWAIENATDDEKRVPMFLSAIGKPIEWVVKVIETQWAEWGYDFIALDHLQQFHSSRLEINRDPYARVTHVGKLFAETIRTIGGEDGYGPAGLILSQFKQTLPAHEWPSRGDLRYAGAVAEDADMILLGHMEFEQLTRADELSGREPQGVRYLRADKARDGITGGTVEVPWDAGTASFQVNNND